MREFAAKIFKGDKVIWGCYAILWIISLVEYYSASAGISLRVSPNFTSQVMGQVGYLMLGLMLMLAIIHIIPRTMFRLIAWLGMPIVLILFVLLFSSHGVTQNEATRQVRLFGFSIQVSEIAKVVLVAYISEILPKGDKKMAFKKIMFLTVFFFFLILPENLSTAIMLYGLSMIIMFVGGIEVKKILYAILIPLLVGLPLFFSSPYWPSELKNSPKSKEYAQMFPEAGFVTKTLARFTHRVPTWYNRVFDDEVNENGEPIDKFSVSYVRENGQKSYSQIAIARGYIPQGPGKSKTRNYLSLCYSDFIFAIILEELGIFGAVALLMLYLIITYRAVLIAKNCDYERYAYLVIGLALIIIIQVFVNMFVVVGIGPVTGQPLPFISDGGTDKIMKSFCLGIILAISAYNEKQKETNKELKENNITTDESAN